MIVYSSLQNWDRNLPDFCCYWPFAFKCDFAHLRLPVSLWLVLSAAYLVATNTEHSCAANQITGVTGITLGSRDITMRLQFQFEEEQQPNTLVGVIPMKPNFTYRFNEDIPEFRLNSSSGAITTAVRIDRERLRSDRFDLVILSSQPTYPIEVRVVVLDINDNSPAFPEPFLKVAFSENANPGTRVILDTATDLDIGRNDMTTDYTIVSGNDGGWFQLVVTTNPSGETPYLHLETLERLDRELQAFYSLNISAQDGGKPPRFGFVTVNVSVLDVNDNPPIFDHSDYSVSLNESVPLGTSVLQVRATDSDDGDNSRITYYLSETESQFSVDSVTGIISTNDSPLECQQLCSSHNMCHKSCVFTVLARDHGSPRQDGRAYVTVNLLDANDHDPIVRFRFFPSTATHATVDENAQNGSVVAAVSVIDYDEGANGETVVEIRGGNEEKHFRLESSSSFDLVRVHGVLDRELVSKYNLTITATDKGVPPRSSTAFLIIHVNDINDHAPTFQKSEYSVILSESVPVGTSVASITATDEDTGINSNIFYSLTSGNDKRWFFVDTISGLVTTAKPLNREESDLVELKISARDGGPSPKWTYTYLKIQILDVNDEIPKFYVPHVNVSLAENVPPGTVVTVLSATDNDLGTNGSVIYSLHPWTEKRYPHVFTVDSSFGRILTQKILDREKIPSYTAMVVARDLGAPPLSSTCTVHITITDVNDNPPFFYPKLYFATVSESTPIGSEIVHIKADDIDEENNAQIAYSIASGAEGKFLIAENGDLRSAAPFAVHGKSKYEILISANNPGGTNSHEMALVYIYRSIGRNMEIKFQEPEGGYAFSIEEDFEDEQPVIGRHVGKVNAGHRVRYSILDGDPDGWFSIEELSGAISTAKVIDREQKPLLNLTVVAYDIQTYCQTQVVITILDVNDCAPQFLDSHDSSLWELQVPENFPPGKEIGFISAVDADEAENGLITYSLSEKSHDLFTIDSQTGMLRVKKSMLWLHSSQDIELEVLAEDGGIRPLSTLLKVQVYLTDVNDHTPTFPHLSYETSVSEGIPVNDCIFILKAVDEDEGENGHVIYDILAAGNEEQKFGVFPDGSVFVRQALNREIREFYSLTVTARDNGTRSRMSSTVLSIHVTDENDNAPQFMNETFVFYVDENEPPDTFVGRLIADDIDRSRNAELTFSLKSHGKDFTVDPKSGLIRTLHYLDRENLVETSGHDFFVLDAVVSDNGNTRLKSEAKVTIHVVDINDNPPIFSRNLLHLTVSEVSNPGFVITRLSASDRDKGVNGHVLYSIISGDPEHAFAMDEATGQISVAQSLDRETIDRYELIITARDTGETQTFTSSTTVVIAILDENDNAPRFQDFGSEVSVEESIPVGTPVSTFRATDPDLSLNGEVTYSIVAGNMKEAFRMDTKEGVLYVARALDYEERDVYLLNVSARDGGNPRSLSSVVQFKILLLDVNDNAPTFPTAAMVRQIEESLAVGSPVATVSAEDKDSGNNGLLLYSISRQHPPGDFFSINSDTGLISTQKPIDREFSDAFRLTVVASDLAEPPSARLSTEKTMTIIVTDVNDNSPTFVSVDAGILMAGAKQGQVITTLRAHDPDASMNGAVTYELVQGDKQLFSVDRNSGELSLLRQVDHPEVLYTLAVQASDEALGPHRKTSRSKMTIIGGDAKSLNGPLFTSSENVGSVSENVPIGTSVLRVVARSTKGHKVEYFLTQVSSANGIEPRMFAINRQTGVISTANLIDREVGPQVYNLQVYAVEIDALTASSSPTNVSIHILDVNDSPPIFIDSPYNVAFSEDTPPGSVICAVRAVDLDDEGFITYKINFEQSIFILDSKTGLITLQESLDREVLPNHELIIIADDSIQSTETKLKVEVIDTNDNPPVFKENVYSFDILEDVQRGSQVGVIAAVDMDLGVNSHVSYSVISNWGNDVFSLNPQTGIFTLTSRLDYEQAKHYIFVVQAQDSGQPVLSSTVTVFFNVLDVNDNAPLFDPMSYSNEIFENITVGSSIVKISATDLDSGVNGKLIYNIIDGDKNHQFAITATGTIFTTKPLDREQQSFYTLTASATDMALLEEQRLFSTVQVTVILKDVNDKAPEFVTRNTTSIIENSPMNTVIMAIKAIDLDEGRNSYIEYSINSFSNTKLFTLGPIDGLLRINGTIDRELQSQHTIEIVAKDRGFPSQSTTVTIVIDVLDENDNSPVFSPGEYVASVSENVSIGHNILQLSATDEDFGVNSQLHYSITSGDPNHDFMIREDTGIIFVQKGLDYERQNRYILVVQAEDSGHDVRYDTVTVIISVTDINDNPPVFLNSPYEVHVMENLQKLPTSLITLTAKDADETVDNKVQYLIKDGDKKLFKINASSGEISILRSLDREKISEYTLTILAIDSGSPRLTGEGTINIIVNDVNDNVPQFDHNRYIATISENSPPGSSVITITARDKDVGLNSLLRYSLIGNNTIFSVDPVTGVIKTEVALDREKTDQHDLILMVKDSGMVVQNSAQVHVTVRVEDENDHQPQFPEPHYTVYVPDTASAGYYVFGTRAEDPDSGMNSHLVYHLTGIDIDKFHINQDTGVVLLLEKLSNKRDDYKLEIHVTDSGLFPLHSSTELTVKVQSSHLFPFFISHTKSYVISEGMRNKLITTVSATSAQYGIASNINYKISSGNIGRSFDLGINSGELQITNSLDYETVNKYELWIEACDNGSPSLTSAIKLEIQITDINDNSPSFENDVFNVTVGEEINPPAFVSTIKAFDADSGINGEIRYYFESPESESFFSIDSKSGRVYTKTKLDREEKEFYSFVVKAVDQGVPQLTSSCTVLVTLLDKNDNPPRFTRLFSVNVTENAPLGAFVIQVTSSDKDIGENANATYSFTENPGGKFHIDTITGNVTIAGNIDRETRDEYSLKVAAVDGSWHAETLLTVSVQDINDNAPKFNEHSYKFNIPELQPLLSTVGQVTAMDKDKHGPNSMISYYLKRASDFFHINSSTGCITIKRQLSYKRTSKESSPINQHFLKIIATDHGRPPLSSEVNIIITVTDTNNNSPQFKQNQYSTPVFENAAIGLSILEIKAEDELDEGINAEIRYRNIGGNGTLYFEVNEDTGWIVIKKSLIGLKSLILVSTIEAQDLGVPPKTCTTSIYFIVTGENLYSPAFTALSYQVIISENEAIGSVIISVTATDADEGLNGQIVYGITGGNNNDVFSINESSGTISVVKHLDYEEQNVYYLNISALDKGFHSKEAQALLTVIITDVNDNSPLFNSSIFDVQIQENEPIGTIVTQLTATDLDSSRYAVIHYSVVDENAKEFFCIDASSGIVTSKISFDFEDENLYTFEVLASNPGSTLFSTAKLFIHVVGQNEFYPRFVQPMFQFTVCESSEVGTNVGKVQATDEDDGLDGEVYYLLVGSSSEQGFDINSETGIITVAKRLDRESQSRVVLTVMAKNYGSIRGNDTDEAQLVINIEDGNDPPTFSKSFYAVKVNEDVPLGTSVTTIFAYDTDIQHNNSQFSFSIIDGHRSIFTIDPQYGIIQTAALLDRETLDEYNLTVAAIDNGNPPQTGSTTVQVIVVDVNDNGPFFNPGGTVGFISENEPSFSSVMVLSAMDSDLPPNGAPFTYFLVGGDHKDYFELDRHTGLLKTTKSLDREHVSKVELTVEVHDSGSPPKKSHHSIKIFITDKNDSPSFPRALSVYVWFFSETFPGGVIADVHPLDPDDSGEYQCSIMEGNISVFKITEKCNLHVPKLYNPQNYTLTITGNDGRHHNVTSTIHVQFLSFSNKTVENSITIQIPSTSSKDFLSHQYERLHKTLDEIFKEYGKPILYSITATGSNLELTLAVQQGLQYLSSSNLLSLLMGSKNLLENVIKNAVIGYNSCLKMPCLNSGKCTKFLQLQKEMIITDSPSLVMAAPAMRQHFICNCTHGYSGPLCQYQEDPCSPNPCGAGGICNHDGLNFQCVCPPKFEGKTCEKLITSSCISAPCKHGGSCKDAPNGSFFCICRPGFRGSTCELATDNCRPNRCLNGGSCVNNKHNYYCACEDNFYGRHCEHSTFGFHPYSFMSFPDMDASTNDISIIFATNKINSLLVYNFGMQTGGRSDFFALEVVGGNPVFSFGGARTAIASLQIHQTVSDGEWHKVTAIRNGRVASLSVVKCTENGELCEVCSHGNLSCSLSQTGHTGTLNFNGNPMYIGGVLSVDPLIERPGQVATDDFVGCIQSVSVNGKMLDLRKPVMSKNTSPTCGRKDHLCTRSSSKCGENAKCLDNWFGSMCQCSDGIIAFNCNEALEPFSFGTDGSYVEMVAQEKHRRALMLPTNIRHGKDREKRSTSPMTQTKWLSLMFRTRSQNGIILHSVTEEDYTFLQLKDGQMLYVSKTTKGFKQEVLTHSSLSDGYWHTIKLEAKKSRINVINVTIDNYSTKVRADSLHDFLDPYLTSLTVGGYKQTVNEKNTVTGFQGCMMMITVNGEIQAVNSTDSYFQLINFGNFQRGCNDGVLGLDLAPTDPLNIGIILVIVFFVILIVVILISFLVFRQRKIKRDKTPMHTKHNSAGFLASMTADIPRNPQESIFSNMTSTEEMIRNHLAQDLLPKKMEREANIERPQRPDIIEREVINKSPGMTLQRMDEHYLQEKTVSPLSLGMSNLIESEAPEHYDLENASSIAPSDIDICYHYKGFRDGNIRKYKTNPHVPSYHKHNHRHSPHQFQSAIKRDSPRNLIQHTSNIMRESPSAIKMQNTPLARLSPSSELSQQAPRILTLQDISGKPLQTALLATSQGVGPNSERSLTSPVSHLTSSIRSVPRKGKNSKDPLLSLGLTAEEIERLNARPRNSSLVSTLDAVSLSSDDNHEKNKLAELLETNTELLEAPESSTDESGNDSFTCSEFEYDNNYDKVHRDFSPGKMIFSKLTEEDNENEEDSAKTYDGFDSFRGSLSTLVASDDDLSNLSSYTPTNGTLLGWDYLLNWGPNFQNFVGVFNDIAELPNNAPQGKASEQYI